MAEEDPLFNKLVGFAQINEQFNVAFKQLEAQKISNHAKGDILIEYIAREIFIVPYYFDTVVNYFPRELPRILHLALLFGNEYQFIQHRHWLNCILLSKIIGKRPDLSRFIFTYFTQYPSPFATENKYSHKNRKVSLDKVSVNDIDIVEATYFLLKNEPEFFRYRWKWTYFIKQYASHKDVQVVWLAYQTLAIVLGFTELQLKKLISNRIPDNVNINLTYQFNLNSSFSKGHKEVPLFDQQPILSPIRPNRNELVCVSGIYVPSLNQRTKDLLIEVPSTYNNLQKISVGLFSCKALCLQGSIGSGKTMLVTHLALKTGRKLGETFIKLQLGDQTDSKTLLGTYKCTNIPGEFVWQPGILTQAVTEGYWLLLEDIDQANVDVASVLANLLENKSLTVSGYRDSVPITPGFQLFVTQRLITTYTGHHKKQSSAMSLLEKHLVQITVDPLCESELKQILNIRHPQFETIVERLVKVFHLFSNDAVVPIISKGRQISPRDFFKWCSRAAINFDVKSQATALKVFQDAIDVFCCSYSNPAEALNLAKQISTYLGIINEKADYYFYNYKPNIQLTSSHFVSERVSLQREHKMFNKTAKFCFTRPAAVLLERIMCCVNLKEPVLLVGETGTGKTSSVQYLAQILGQKLVVINMNQQSDSTDLLGGFKPIDLKLVVTPVRKEFEEVFCDYFKVQPNKQYLANIAYCFNKQRYSDLVKLMFKSTNAAIGRLKGELNESVESDQAKKQKSENFLKRWQSVKEKLSTLDAQLKQKNALAFAFVEGTLVKAVRNGHWILLDEINLASAETLDCLSGLLEDTESSFCLLESGDKTPIRRHPNFTLFACMNPSTDVGKRDLPSGLRNRFTEFFIEELVSKSDLILLVQSYLQAIALKDRDIVSIVEFYLRIRHEVQTTLSDGLGHKPHFSLRTLCRALMITSRNPCGTFRKSLYEAFCLSFLTNLDSPSYKLVETLIFRHLVGDKNKTILGQKIPKPDEPGNKFVEFEGYWVTVGSEELHTPKEYILTQSVRKNLKDLVRVVSIGRLPVLLQGDTSVGKTSLITYLATASGNKCVRINNHEHTDLQEYIGSYVADPNGKLVFREGVLVEAMRKGHWIILDELNLAPTDVLEALNRVLDDNRELFIPETQEIVKADPNFMLFATQNPPGIYGGRKMLSRAFRNRFVELHFNEIPPNELEEILHKRCQMAQSYAKKMIMCMTDLQMRRRESAAFAGKQGFITLRDLFRWGERYRLAQNKEGLYDWDQHMVDEGYLVLAGKVRKDNEKKEIVEVLQKHWKRNVVLENLFTLHEKSSVVTRHILEQLDRNSSKFPNLVWTFNMRKLAVLIQKALQFKEPVLLVGETGGGKTTICQVIADIKRQELVTINCHMHTESSDFIGGLRPVRDHSTGEGALFEWVDGPLLQAMRKGSIFLADEISLADDSVLERLNSLLEPERSLLLAEKGIDLNNRENSELVIAHPDFFFIGTMNPGGDFGKKELSPALRNRFTEMWCDSHSARDDMVQIIERNIKTNKESGFGNKIMDFIEWFSSTQIGKRCTVTIRDVLTWVNFINCCSHSMSYFEAYYHGARLVFLDELGSGLTSSESVSSLTVFKSECEKFLKGQFIEEGHQISIRPSKIINTESHFGIEPFSIPVGIEKPLEVTFLFQAPTTLSNALVVLRGMQLNKPILLEGSPGVGKTSLVTALAKISRHKLFRVNLSEQTDISDLFGADLPVEGSTGQFSWRDGPLLQALKEGSWILLDELNLASQSVLEGLNACLDHRGEIFVPELGKTFYVQQGTRFFGCQNPMRQGGSRKGLPRSFLNRFIQVFVSSLTMGDMKAILTSEFPLLPHSLVEKMIEFNYRLNEELEKRNFGQKGAPWECNLRDLTRWCEAVSYQYNNSTVLSRKFDCQTTMEMIYANRMRVSQDRQHIINIFNDVMGCQMRDFKSVVYVNEEEVYFGDVCLKRASSGINENSLKKKEESIILRKQMSSLRSLAYCVNLNWMAILVGGPGSGKSHLVKTLAALTGKTLHTFPVTSAMDTTDILGGFEQTNYSRHLEEIAKVAEYRTLETVQNLLLEEKIGKAVQLLEFWEEYLIVDDIQTKSSKSEAQLFLKKVTKLEALLKELYLKSNDAAEGTDILNLIHKCTEIHKTVSGDMSVSAGGRFEWMHSLLIKCLKEGSWLLIDNVNLCNAAVLDRLNALLEPNGVLSVCEKGVDENGQFFEIKPHNNFRLFLAMDPKNGEISRAMRNRGLEIFVDDLLRIKTSNNFDIRSLIALEGLSDKKHIDGVLHVHNFVSSLILTDKPGTSEILQYSSLVGLHIRQGFPLLQALYDPFVEVYFKRRSPSEFNSNNILQVVEEQIKKCLDKNVEYDIDCWYNRDVSLNTKDLPRWSELEKIKNQAAFFEHSMGLLQTGNSLLQFFKAPNTTLDCLNVIRPLTKNKGLLIWSDLEKLRFRALSAQKTPFYFIANITSNIFTITSKNDLPYRLLYVKEFTPTSEWQDFIDRVLKVMTIFTRQYPNLPVDYRWIEDAPRCDLDEILCDSSNLAIQIEIQKLLDTLDVKMMEKNTLYQYVLLRQKSSVSNILDSPILDNYLTLQKEFYIYLRQLTIKLGKLSVEEVIEIVECLSWRHTLHSFLTTVDFQQSGYSNKLVVTSKTKTLVLVYKWFYKYSVMKLSEIVKSEVPEALNRLVTLLNQAVDNQYSSMHRLSKNYKKLDHIPHQFRNEEQISVAELIDSTNYYSEDVKSQFVELKIQLCFNTLDSQKFTLLKSLVNDDKNCMKFTQCEMQILPVLNTLTHLMILKALHNIEKDSSSDLDSVISNFMVPLPLHVLLAAYKQTSDKSLLHEIRKLYYSFAMTPIVNTEANKSKNLSPVGLNPIISSAICDLFASETRHPVTLENYKEVMKQHKLLSAVLWNNFQSFSDKSFNFLHLHLEMLEQNIKDFFNRLQKTLGINFCNLETAFCNISELQALKLNAEFVQCVREIYDQYKSIHNTKDKDSLLNLVADLHILLGYTKAHLYSWLPSVDPLVKKTLKSIHISSVIGMFEQMKKSFELQHNLFTVSGVLHPYLGAISDALRRLESTMETLKEDVVMGPKEVFYDKVVQEIQHAFESIVNNNILKQREEINKLLITAVRNKTLELAIAKTQVLISCIETIMNDWKPYRYSYPDIFEPLLCNIAQILYGLKVKLFICKRRLDFAEEFEEATLMLTRFPSLNSYSSSISQHIDGYLSKNMQKLMFSVWSDHDIEKHKIRLLKCAIQESFNLCLVDAKTNGILDQKLVENFNNFVEIFIQMWTEQEENEAKRQQEAESLYKTRTKCEDKSEEEQSEEEFGRLFPNWFKGDFPDFDKATESDEQDNEANLKNSQTAITEDDLKLVLVLHSKLFQNFTRTEWLAPKTGKNIIADIKNPLIEKYKLFQTLISDKVDRLGYSIDEQLLVGLMAVVETSRCFFLGKDNCGQPIGNIETKDFYTDTNISEVIQSYDLLQDLRIRIYNLLEQWPGQPTLTSIVAIIDRILNFHITSPVSRYLGGLELLLDKCYEWEQVAHSGVSVSEFCTDLIGQIISWRKLELSKWKDLLNSTFERLKAPLKKWWVYLYKIMNLYIVKRNISLSELIKTLKDFVTKSNLVEFEGRVELLFEFHCRAVVLREETLANVLWNLHNYYKQFYTAVNSKLKDMRSPLEKKIKDYLKIIKWKDVNYWTVKKTIQKSHKQLYKFVKEYKQILLTLVSTYLVNTSTDETVGIWDRPLRQNPKPYHYTLDVDSYLIKSLGKDRIVTKSRKVCKDLILGAKYPVLLQCLDSFVGDVIENSIRLRNLEVDTTLPLEKRKSQAKTILQQKQRALSDLFKSLSKIGMSYKAGLVKFNAGNFDDNLLIKPINLEAGFTHLEYNRTDEKMLTIWDSCETYYYRCLVRFDILVQTLKNPLSEFGIGNIERCKGYAAHLLESVRKQKRSLASSTRLYYYFRACVKQLHEVYETTDRISSVDLIELKNVLTNVAASMAEIKLILECCPKEDIVAVESAKIPILDSTSRQFRCQNTDEWKQAVCCLESALSSVTRLSNSLQKINPTVPITEEIIVPASIQPFMDRESFNLQIISLIDDMEKLNKLLEPSSVVQSIQVLCEQLKNVSSKCQCGPTLSGTSADLEYLTSKLTKAVQIVFQKLYKTHGNADHNQDSELLDLEEDHLKTLIVDNLSLDVSALDLTNLLNLTNKLLNATLESQSKSSVPRCLPLLDQVLLLAQYFITHQVSSYRITCKLTSSLLNMFIELVSKGFCIPPELSSEKDSEGPRKPSDGLGLGEGQGERDVSDRIESEDQLEDAHPGQTEKDDQEDEDCKEEDKGIEMSEDFDSKLQDKQPNDSDDEQSDSDSDKEEQMGETESGADKLDKEIWGSDNEDEKDNDSELDENEKGEMGENKDGGKIGAKENDKSGKNEDQKETDENETEDNEKDEINDLKDQGYDDQQIDPLHGNQPDLPEPEQMDLPDDLQLDDGEGNDNEETDDNPFEDNLEKDLTLPEDLETKENQEEDGEKQKDDETAFSSDDEEVTEKDSNIADRDDIEENEKQEDSNKDKSTEAQDILDDDLESQEKDETSAPDQNPSGEDGVEPMDDVNCEPVNKTQAVTSDDTYSEKPNEIQNESNNDGLGQSEMEDNTAGNSASMVNSQQLKNSQTDVENEEITKQKPAKSDSKRSLGEVSEPLMKKRKTVDAKSSQEDLDEKQDVDKMDIFEHIEEAKEKAPAQMLDAATEEQIEKSRGILNEEQQDEVANEEQVQNIEEIKEKEIQSRENVEANQKEFKSGKEKSGSTKDHPKSDLTGNFEENILTGENISTMTVERGTDSYHCTQLDVQSGIVSSLSPQEIIHIRSEVEAQLASKSWTPTSMEAEQTWQKITSLTGSLAQELSEQLRLVLEPTQASQLKGDFRTGRRINMRKIIPYIASQFRKDKIWLRRTKPSKREYQIALAIDDSSSMNDSHSKELAFESVALISKALSLLESGQLGVLSFGESAKVHHNLTEPFTSQCGVELLQTLKFDQQKTCIGNLVDFATEFFELSPSRSNAPNAKLLLIVSDGRGIFSEGEAFVRQAIRRAQLAGIFMVFVIIDSPTNRDSILDIRQPIFKDGKLVEMKSYMAAFPFSFYIILKDINFLPNVLSDALRQWFEMVSSVDNLHS